MWRRQIAENTHFIKKYFHTHCSKIDISVIVFTCYIFFSFFPIFCLFSLPSTASYFIVQQTAFISFLFYFWILFYYIYILAILFEILFSRIFHLDFFYTMSVFKKAFHNVFIKFISSISCQRLRKRSKVKFSVFMLEWRWDGATLLLHLTLRFNS